MLQRIRSLFYATVYYSLFVCLFVVFCFFGNARNSGNYIKKLKKKNIKFHNFLYIFNIKRGESLFPLKKFPAKNTLELYIYI